MSNQRVALSFSGGVTDASITGARGVAQISHASSGQAKVIVGGSGCDSLHAPGKTTVNI